MDKTVIRSNRVRRDAALPAASGEAPRSTAGAHSAGRAGKLRRCLVLGFVVALAGVIAAPAGAVTPSVQVDGAVQVTGAPTSVRAYASPVIAVDPQNANVVAVATPRPALRSARCRSRRTPG